MRDPNREKTGFFQSLKNKISKPKIAEDILIIHERQMVDLRFLAKMAYVIDNDKFGNKEFLIYVKLNYCLQQGIQGYEGLYKPAKLVKVAIQAKDSFIKIDQGELRYRGSKQQELYEFLNERLISLEEMNDSTNIFRAQLENKIEEIIPQIKTDEGKEALKAYVKEVERISDHELGLKLLSLFKSYNLDDYSILRKISDVANSLKKSDLLDFRGLVTLVIGQFETFQKLGRIVGVPEKKDTPETYAIILQYIALEYRHGLVRVKFDQLMEVMRKWYKPYQTISNLRSQFSPSEYQIPKEFSEPIPGVDIYEKYVDYLTDKRTGQTYINFE